MTKNKTTLLLAVLLSGLTLTACQPKKTDAVAEDASSAAASQVAEKARPSLTGESEKLQLDLPDCRGKNCPELTVERLQSNQPILDKIIDQAVLAHIESMLSVAQDETVTPKQVTNKNRVKAEMAGATTASAAVETISPTQQLTEKVQPFVKTFLAIDQDLKANGVAHKISLSISPRILNSEAPIATVVLNSSSYLGGAHGASGQRYYNFDLEQQQQVQLKDLLQDNQDSALKKLVYSKFKQWVVESKLATNVAEYEQVWKFSLTDNFYLAKQGLILQYGEYEIGPYVVGLPRFEIPYAELKGILKPEYLPAEVTQAANSSAQAVPVAKAQS